MKVPRALAVAAAVSVVVWSSGCDLFGGDDDGEEDGSSALVIANGGNFGDQNGFLTLYDPETGVRTDLADLGAFVQSITLDGDLAYVSLNTFTVGRVDVVDLGGGQVVKQIAVPAPRATALLGSGRLVATNLSVFGSNGPEPGKLSVIDLDAGSAAPAEATVGLYPEGIVVVDGIAYVANSGNLGDGTTLSVVNPNDDSESRIELGCDGPNEVFSIGQDELAVVCEGKVVYNEDFTEIIEETNGQVVFVSLGSSTVTRRLELDIRPGSANGSQSAYYDAASDELYVISDAADQALRIDAGSKSLETTLDVPDQEDLTGLSAVAYDDRSERLYLARIAKGAGGFPDFTSAGAVIILDRSGAMVGRFGVGPAPSQIAVR